MRWQDRFKIVPAVYVLLERDGKILLLRRANTGYKDGYYTTPSGHMEGNEPPTVAAARETLEEAGVTVDPADLEFIQCTVSKAIEGDHERLSLFFRAKKFTGEPCNMEPDKCDDMGWFPMDALPDKLVPEMHRTFGYVAEGKYYSEANY